MSRKIFNDMIWYWCSTTVNERREYQGYTWVGTGQVGNYRQHTRLMADRTNQHNSSIGDWTGSQNHFRCAIKFNIISTWENQSGDWALIEMWCWLVQQSYPTKGETIVIYETYPPSCSPKQTQSLRYLWITRVSRPRVDDHEDALSLQGRGLTRLYTNLWNLPLGRNKQVSGWLNNRQEIDKSLYDEYRVYDKSRGVKQSMTMYEVYLMGFRKYHGAYGDTYQITSVKWNVNFYFIFHLNIFFDCTRINDPRGTFQMRYFLYFLNEGINVCTFYVLVCTF